MNVAVLGASRKAERYSNRAVLKLAEKGHTVFPINPALAEIQGIPVYPRMAEIPVPIDTATVYLAAARSSVLLDDFLELKPRRVILNPGAENPPLAAALAAEGIEILNACTLVLLATGQF